MPAIPSPSDPFARDVFALFGLVFDLDDLEATARRVVRSAECGERLFLSTVNLDWLVQAERDPAFRDSALASNHVTMDGVPVVRLARMAGVDAATKVAGSDLFERLRRERLSVFFFGGRPGAAEAASEALTAADGPMRSAGWHDPGFGDVASMSTPGNLAAVNESGADLLVVALGAKKGQAWLMANKDRLFPPVITHLGAVVDFTAGTVSRAPRALQVSGLEWAWRIGQDPVLWSRYATDFAALPRLVATARLAKRHVAASRRSAGPGTAKVAGAGDGCKVTIDGVIDVDQIRTALRDAYERGGPVEIELGPEAAPDLRGFGQLIVARQVWETARRRYALCTRDGKTGHSVRAILGSDAVERTGL